MRWGLPIALGLLLAACYSPSPATGAPCASNGECPSGQVCDPQRKPPVCLASLPAADARVVDGKPRSPDGPPILPDAPAANLLVQQITAAAATGTPLTATLPALPTSGHVLVMIGADIHAALTSVSGGGVAAWTRATASSSNTNIEVWYGTTDGSSAEVSIALTGNVDDIWMNVTEWSGLVSPGALGGATSNAGVSSPAQAGPIGSSHPRDLLLFGVADATPNTFGTPAPGAWTELTPVSVGGATQSAWYMEVATSAVGSYSASITETGGNWDAALVALQVM